MASGGQLAAMPRQPGRGEVVQHQGAAHQVLARQGPLEGGLRLVQPVQGAVQIVGLALTHAQHAAQRAGGGVVMQHAVGGELGGGRQHACAEHGQQHRSQLLGRTGKPLLGPTGARRAEHGGHVAVGQAALDGHERVDRLHGHAALEQEAKVLDQLRIPVGQVGQGALDDLAAFAIALAQQHGGWGVAVGDGLDVHTLHGIE